jgi:hypothetical protein
MPGTASRFIPLKRAAAYPTTTGIRQLAQVLTEPLRLALDVVDSLVAYQTIHQQSVEPAAKAV